MRTFLGQEAQLSVLLKILLSHSRSLKVKKDYNVE